MARDKVFHDITHEVVEKSKASATIEWAVNRSARTELMVFECWPYDEYGYTTDKLKRAIDTIPRQMESIVEHLVGHD